MWFWRLLVCQMLGFFTNYVERNAKTGGQVQIHLPKNLQDLIVDYGR